MAHTLLVAGLTSGRFTDAQGCKWPRLTPVSDAVLQAPQADSSAAFFHMSRNMSLAAVRLHEKFHNFNFIFYLVFITNMWKGIEVYLVSTDKQLLITNIKIKSIEKKKTHRTPEKTIMCTRMALRVLSRQPMHWKGHRLVLFPFLLQPQWIKLKK